MKVERFITEFARNFCGGYPQPYKSAVGEKCNRIIRQREKGYITAFEAVRAITDIYYSLPEDQPLF